MADRIHFLASDTQGGGWLRSFWPAESLRARGWLARATAAPDGLPRDLEGLTAVIHRPLATDTLDKVRALRRAGARVLVDEDDDLTSVPRTNRVGHQRWTGPAKVLHDQAIQEADGLIVSTEPLAEVYGHLAQEVFICRNRLPERALSYQFVRRPGQPVRVGWTGITRTHLHDLHWLRPEMARACLGAVFTTVGDRDTAKALKVDTIVEWYPWQESEMGYYRLMARADIGMVPLAPIQFNRSKSWLKALEYMTLGKPVVVTDLPEQRLLIRHGVDGFLAADPDEFATLVQTLVHDEALRVSMGQAARERAKGMVLEHHVLEEWGTAIAPVRADVD